MTRNIKWVAGACVMSAVVLAGCDRDNMADSDVADSIESSLNDANLDDVNVQEDRDKGVVTLTGSVRSDADKERAEAIAKAAAPSGVIANEILVEPAGMEDEARDVADDLDAGIESNLEAAFTKEKIDDVNYEVETQVVTLNGNVASAAERTRIEKIAAGVPNVKQVVNKLEVTNQRENAPATTR